MSLLNASQLFIFGCACAITKNCVLQRDFLEDPETSICYYPPVSEPCATIWLPEDKMKQVTLGGLTRQECTTHMVNSNETAEMQNMLDDIVRVENEKYKREVNLTLIQPLKIGTCEIPTNQTITNSFMTAENVTLDHLKEFAIYFLMQELENVTDHHQLVDLIQHIHCLGTGGDSNSFKYADLKIPASPGTNKTCKEDGPVADSLISKDKGRSTDRFLLALEELAESVPLGIVAFIAISVVIFGGLCCASARRRK